MKQDLVLDERELKEIHHSLYYRANLAHGTVGHNLLMLVGKMAEAMGFTIDETGVMMFEGSDVRKELTIK
jgi:hypothetical protein